MQTLRECKRGGLKVASSTVNQSRASEQMPRARMLISRGGSTCLNERRWDKFAILDSCTKRHLNSGPGDKERWLTKTSCQKVHDEYSIF